MPGPFGPSESLVLAGDDDGEGGGREIPFNGPVRQGPVSGDGSGNLAPCMAVD